MARFRWGWAAGIVSVRRGQGLPEHSQFQLAAADPLQDTAEDISQAGGALGKMY